MLTSRFKNIKKILKDFTGKNGEPKNNKEFYVLKSMWVMMCAEFEGSLKDSVENYIDCIKTKPRLSEERRGFVWWNDYLYAHTTPAFPRNEVHM